MPRATAPFPTATTTDTPGIYGSIEPDQPYVWPDIEHEAAEQDVKHSLVLIAAPGAMGKSYAAKNLAHATNAIYVDLAQLRVGSGTLTGELTKSLGFTHIGPFVSALKAGQASLVLDSTDEALLSAGRDNYAAFLGDLWWLMHDAVASNQVILLGRPDASDTTMSEVTSLGLSATLASVAPLNHAQATELIDLTLDARTKPGRYEIHRRHAEPFAQFRETVFRDIAAALSGVKEQSYWERSADFLGYPPVLIALAERLAVENPSAALSEEFTHDSRRRRGVLLKGIVEYILERERRKVQSLIGDALGIEAGSPKRQVLYQADEQISRLLDFTGTAGISLDVPAILDESDRKVYEDSVTGFLIDHPFLRSDHFSNIVFADYARAWAVSSPISGLYASNRAEFLATLPSAGPFFTHFLHALGGSSGDVATIPEDLVDDAIKSFNLSAGRAWAFYGHRDQGAILILSTDLSDLDGGMSFDVVELSGILTLRSPLARLTVATRFAVLVEGGKSGIDVGPSVTLIASELEFQGKSLTAYGPPETRNSERVEDQFVPLSMLTAQVVRHDPELKVSANPGNSLTVYWPSSWHQWKPWLAAFDPNMTRLESGISAQALICLRRLLTSFKSSVRDDPSVSADKVDRVLIGANVVFQATLSSLIKLGLVSRDTALYRLHLDKLSAYEFSYSDLRGDDPIKPLEKLLNALTESSEFEQFHKAS